MCRFCSEKNLRVKTFDISPIVELMFFGLFSNGVANEKAHGNFKKC